MTVAFALSGGGNLGPMQAGSILALVEAGIEPDLLVGTSVGALNSAFLASRPGVSGARSLVDAWSALRRPEAFQLSMIVALAGFLGLRDHLIGDQQLRRLIQRWVEIDRIEDAAIPFAVTTTDALTGDCIVLSSGDVVDCLAASCAIPGLFPPVRIGGRWLVDGSLSANQPVLQAQALGADQIYVITTATEARQRPPRGAIALAMNSVSLVTSRVAREHMAQASAVASTRGGHVFLVPSSEPRAPTPFNFRRSAELASAAYARTASWLIDAESSDARSSGRTPVVHTTSVSSRRSTDPAVRGAVGRAQTEPAGVGSAPFEPGVKVDGLDADLGGEQR